MTYFDINKVFKAQLTDSDFYKLSKFIYKEYGIKMPKIKKVMLQSRLQKRLRALQIDSYKKYIEYVFSVDGKNEIIHMIDVVSTNKTDFFREPYHFEFLMEEALPYFIKNKLKFHLNAWSAGCSSGEEPYTMAIVMNEFSLANPNFDYSILGTDISTRVLKSGMEAVYSSDKVDVIPLSLKKKYLLKSKDQNKKLVKIITNIRQKVIFQRLNFIDSTYNVKNYHMIFCRNVLIYFDRKTQESVINKLARHLVKGGFFFLGHSESTTGIDVPLKQIRPTVFQKI